MISENGNDKLQSENLEKSKTLNHINFENSYEKIRTVGKGKLTSFMQCSATNFYSLLFYRTQDLFSPKG